MRGRLSTGRQDEGVILTIRHLGGIEVLGEPRAMPAPQQAGASQQNPEHVAHLDVTSTNRVHRVAPLFHTAYRQSCPALERHKKASEGSYVPPRTARS
jgi:hypothetical protein